MKEILLFQIGDQRYGLDLRQIKQIQRRSGLFANPVGGKASRTLVFEGEKMTLCDPGAIFGAAPSALDPRRRKLLVVDVGGQSLALAVDQIEQVVAVQSGQIDALPPCFDGTSHACFPMVLRQGGESILVIDPGEVARLEVPSDAPKPAPKTEESLALSEIELLHLEGQELASDSPMPLVEVDRTGLSDEGDAQWPADSVGEGDRIEADKKPAVQHFPLELAVKRAVDPSRLENIVAKVAQEAVSNCFPELFTDTLAKIKRRELGKLKRAIRAGTGYRGDSTANINNA